MGAGQPGLNDFTRQQRCLNLVELFLFVVVDLRHAWTPVLQRFVTTASMLLR